MPRTQRQVQAIEGERQRWPAERVEMRNVADLEPYARNSRTHSPEQVAKIAKSIEEFGFTNPVLVDENGVIIAGHGRVLAAKRLNLPAVPVMIAHGWADAQKRAYVIADNKLALDAGWDNEILNAELKALDDLQFDLTLTGFTLDEIGDLTLALNPERDERDDGGAGSGEMNTVIQFNIVFDNTDQQDKWFKFVRRLKAEYPDDETLGQRLGKFIDTLEAATDGHGS